MLRVPIDVRLEHLSPMPISFIKCYHKNIR